MRKNNKIGMFAVFCFSLLFFQCSTDENDSHEEKTTTKQNAAEIIMLRDYLLTSLNIDSKDILYDVNKNVFVIDKDMLVSLEEARLRFKNSSITNKTNQRADKYQMTSEISKSVKVYVSPEVSED